MAQRCYHEGIEIEADDAIARGMISWLNERGSSIAYTPISDPSLAPPAGRARGIVVHPDDYNTVLDAIASKTLNV